jgi:hypothetical protein
MDHPVSGHLLNASALALAALAALAADRLSAGPAGPATGARGGADLGDVSAYVAATVQSAPLPRNDVRVAVEPFEGTPAALQQGNSVASPRNSSTVSAGAPGGRRLTAILIADNKPIAVVSDEVVGVGDFLKDGARVSRIQSDRVFLIEKNGKWRTLTLAQGRP